MESLSSAEKSQNYINTKNELNSTINKLSPLLLERLSQGYKLKADGSLFKKDKEDVRAIIDSVVESSLIRAYVTNEYGNIKLKIDIRYEDSEYGCSYISEYVYLVNSDKELLPFEEYPTDFSVEEHYASKVKLREIEEQIRELESKKSELKRKYNI